MANGDSISRACDYIIIYFILCFRRPPPPPAQRMHLFLKKQLQKPAKVLSFEIIAARKWEDH